ncbi:phosphatase PAP2 family protein [Persicitalea jodogahamensis]|uniref:phosphatase PAP2 family protein n=1 Tax=Persicitalea jodogahamensis TaxID=402147 RepID=UPI0016736EE9|nr:phosphatase PAP2 family protein [Persicitalea jodogahamensis]
MSQLLDHIIQFDQNLFLWLNGHHNRYWDAVMIVITNKLTWIPLYVLLLYAIIKQFKLKAIGLILSILAVVTLSDQIASTIFKPYFMRPRPCHEPSLESLIHLVGGCGGEFGFVSSHAATSFGIALIINLLPTSRLRATRWLFLWALVYSFSRIYVGVHYPLDLLVGAVVGVLSALLIFYFYIKLNKDDRIP